MLVERSEIIDSAVFVHPDAPARFARIVDPNVPVYVFMDASDEALPQRNPGLFRVISRRKSRLTVMQNTKSDVDQNNIVRLMEGIHVN